MSVLGHRLRAYRQPAAAGSWTPAELPSLVVWYDADTAGDFTLSGSDITQWNDKSGNARHLTNTGTVTRQTAVQNGRAVARFTAASSAYLQYFNASAWMTSSQVGFGWVGKMTSSTNSNGRLAAMTAENGSRDYETSANAILGNRDSSNQALSCNVATAAPTALSVTYNTWFVESLDVTSGTLSLRVNGGTANTVASSPSFTTKRFRVGAGIAAGADFWDGDMGEIVLTSTITSTNREKLEGYLAWRWGLQANLPGGHPYAGGAP